MPAVNPELVISDTEKDTIKALCNYLLEALEVLSQKRSFITIGLSGGSFIKAFSDEIVNYKEKFQKYVPKLRFILCDERFVPLDHADSTYYGFVKNNFFTILNVPAENVYPIKPDTATVEECAQDYENRIRPLLNENKGFDILLLGIGPDGHTCSLFPDHELFLNRANEKKLVVACKNSPKPPPLRVTLTFEYINNSQHLLFCAYGEGKAQIMKQIYDKDASLPSVHVSPVCQDGRLVWFIDRAIAKNIC